MKALDHLQAIGRRLFTFLPFPCCTTQMTRASGKLKKHLTGTWRKRAWNSNWFNESRKIDDFWRNRRTSNAAKLFSWWGHSSLAKVCNRNTSLGKPKQNSWAENTWHRVMFWTWKGVGSWTCSTTNWQSNTNEIGNGKRKRSTSKWRKLKQMRCSETASSTTSLWHSYLRVAWSYLTNTSS